MRLSGEVPSRSGMVRRLSPLSLRRGGVQPSRPGGGLRISTPILELAVGQAETVKRVARKLQQGSVIDVGGDETYGCPSPFSAPNLFLYGAVETST